MAGQLEPGAQGHGDQGGHDQQHLGHEPDGELDPGGDGQAAQDRTDDQAEEEVDTGPQPATADVEERQGPQVVGGDGHDQARSTARPRWAGPERDDGELGDGGRTVPGPRGRPAGSTWARTGASTPITRVRHGCLPPGTAAEGPPPAGSPARPRRCRRSGALGHRTPAARRFIGPPPYHRPRWTLVLERPPVAAGR